MTTVKIKSILVLLVTISLFIVNIGNAFAVTQVGTGSVSGTTSFDSAINWDENFPGTASGSVSGVVITATVEPTLNISFSTGAIDLGTLNPGIASSGSLDVEVGTNAVDGINITVRSNSGGLTHTSDDSVQINNLTTDGTAESYKYTSGLSEVADSTVGGFTSSSNLDTQISDNTTEHTIYTTNKPEQTDGSDIEFVVEATANAQTQAGNYKDTVTFTITGNF